MRNPWKKTLSPPTKMWVILRWRGSSVTWERKRDGEALLEGLGAELEVLSEASGFKEGAEDDDEDDGEDDDDDDAKEAGDDETGAAEAGAAEAGDDEDGATEAGDDEDGAAEAGAEEEGAEEEEDEEGDDGGLRWSNAGLDTRTMLCNANLVPNLSTEL
jgi:hypothetical protein